MEEIFRSQLEPRLLLQKTRSDIASHFKHLISTHGDAILLNNHLLSLVHTEAIPVLVYEIWFHLAIKDAPDILLTGLFDRVSQGIRKTSIYALTDRFRTRWVQTWDFLGGAAGVHAIIDHLSQKEVSRLVTALVPLRLHDDRTTIAGSTQELLRLVKESDEQTGRSILPLLDPLKVLCEESRVLEYLNDLRYSSQPMLERQIGKLAHFNLNLLRRIAIGAVDVSTDVRSTVLSQCTQEMISSREVYKAAHYHEGLLNISPGMAFCLDLAHDVSTNIKRGAEIRADVVRCIQKSLKHASARRFSLDITLKFIQRILPVYFAPDSRTQNRWTTEPVAEEMLWWWCIARTSKRSSIQRSWLKNIVRKTHPSEFSMRLDIIQAIVIKTLVGPLRTGDSDIKRKREYCFSYLDGLIKKVPPGHRMALLKLVCRELDTIDVDLEVWPPSKHETELFPIWPMGILRDLPPLDSKILFDRLLAINECGDFLPAPEGASSYSGISWVDQCLLKISWEREEGPDDSYPFTRKVLTEMKQRSQTSRDPQERLKWAKTALKAANTSFCLNIFQETVEWSTRFLRDHVVFPELLTILFSWDSARVLACRHMGPVREPKTLSEMKTIVDKSHEILEIYLDIIRRFIREPHYKPYFTRGIPSLFDQLLDLRTEDFQKINLGVESDVADVLLYPLSTVFLNFERLANTEDPKKFTWSGLRGVVSGQRQLLSPSMTVLSFLDHYARERQQFWLSKRSDKDLEVVDLPVGFPQGLPLQDLLAHSRWGHYAVKYPDAMPYISSRVAELLTPSTTMLNIVSDKLAERKLPVDHLSYAIEIATAYIVQGEKEEAFMHIWKKFSTALSAHPDQRDIFNDWLIDLAAREGVYNLYSIIRPPPPPKKPSAYIRDHFDQYSGPDEVIEWDPRGDNAVRPVVVATTEAKPRRVTRTMLIYQMEAENRLSRKPSTRPPQPNPMALRAWCSADRKRLTLAEHEGIILSALLYLGGVAQRGKRILSHPFPSADSLLRFPAVYLADEFLTAARELGEKPLHEAARALLQYPKSIPAHLLHDVIVSLLGLLQESQATLPNYSTILSITADLIKLLQETDQPQLAIDVVLRFLDEFPEASSYHRQMRPLALGARLLPQDAELLVRKFADTICTHLQSMSAQSEQTPNKKYVKVTTIKMLAQLLAEATFIPIPIALDTLQTLFNVSRHIDVRTAVVQAVLSLLYRDTEYPAIYDCFISMTSAASEPNERQIIKEEDWLDTEKGEKPLPEIAPPSERPLLDILMGFSYRILPPPHKGEFIQKVLLPVVKESARQHARWLHCFLAHLPLSPEETQAVACLTSFCPFNPDLIDRLFLNKHHELPQSYLEQQRGWAFAYLQYPHFITINKKLSERDKGWRETSAGKHWLALQTKLRNDKPFAVLEHCISKCDHRRSHTAEGCITLTDVMEEYVYRAGVVTRNPLKYDGSISHLVVSPDKSLGPLRWLRQQRNKRYAILKNELSHHFALIQRSMEQIVVDVESLRTPGWITGPGRSPVILPSPLDMEIMLVPSPGYNPEVPDPARGFEREVLRLVEKCADNPLLLVEFEAIKGLIDQVEEKDLAAFVLFFGQWGEKDCDTLLARLRMQTALSALQKIKLNSIKPDSELMEMIRKWKLSGSEWVRRAGWTLDGKC